MKKYFSLIVMIVLFSFTFGEEIVVWDGWVNKEKEVLNEVMMRYEQLSGNKIKRLNVPSDALTSKFGIMAPRGQGPDIIIGPADWIGNFVSQNLLEEMDDKFDEEYLKKYIPMTIEGSKLNGKLYGLPQAIHIVSLYYNPELIDTPPKTTNEMIKLAKEISNPEEEMFGLVYEIGNYYYHAAWIGGFGGEILDKNGRPTFNQKPQIDAGKFIRKLISPEMGIMPSEVDYNTMSLLFQEKQAAMMITGNWTTAEMMESGAVDFKVARLPMVSETGLWPKPICGPEVVMMSKYSKNKKEALTLLKYLTSEDAQLMFIEAGHLPTIEEVYDYQKLKKSKYYEYFKAFKDQVEESVPMPTRPEMGIAIWAAGSSYLSGLLGTEIDAEDLAEEAQEKAEKSLEESGY